MTFKTFVEGIVGIFNTVVIPVIFSLALLVFVWGVFNHFFSQDETKRGKGKSFVLWGLLGLVLMFSIWGLLNILLSTLGIGGRG
jgi:hypothetical protein